MGNGSEKNASDTPEQHPYVEQIRPEPSKPPKEVTTLTGLLGRSDRDGHQRLYFTRDLGTFAEFLASDVLFVEPVPAAESPVAGIDASRVTLSRDATIHYTRSTKAAALDDFDLDVRTARAGAAVGAQPAQPTFEAACPPPSFFPPCPTDFTCACGDTFQITLCRGRTCINVCNTRPTCVLDETCNTCETQCGRFTCVTCQTRCIQNTCQNTCQPTCQTCPGQPTCQTCPGQPTCQTCPGQPTCQTCPGQPTCQTCRTDCGGRTCITCDTCNPHIPACQL